MLAGESKRANLEKMVDYLTNTPITSISQAQESLELGSFTTIERYIEKLVEPGILKGVTGRARKRIYRADAILRALEEDIEEQGRHSMAAAKLLPCLQGRSGGVPSRARGKNSPYHFIPTHRFITHSTQQCIILQKK